MKLIILESILVLSFLAYKAQSSSCPLIEYNYDRFYSDDPIRIHPDFKPYMDSAANASKTCDVIVLFKKSFVKDVDGKFLQSVVASARKPYSNHFIGHAVNFVVSKKTLPLKFCRKDCLESKLYLQYRI